MNGRPSKRSFWPERAAAALGNLGGGDVTASGIKSLAGAENALAGALGKLNVVMEAYPDLKASANMQQLSETHVHRKSRGIRPSGLLTMR
ncbi:MAG: hypothetical protein CM15mP74_06710 [Halieaceae bacterium]|nr:MAG: hypothetical protein CM15mP74_06710 [Halieaceae bacterium]